MTNMVIDHTVGFELGGIGETEEAFSRPLGSGIYSYARRENPTVAECERALADIENAAWCLLAPCGMAAINIALSVFNDPGGGRPYLFPPDVYSGTRDYATRILEGQRGLAVRFAEPAGRRTTTENLLRAIADDAPGVVFVEPISNPLLDIIDVGEVVAAAHAAGARVIVDNTFATPFLYHPLAAGADIVVHSGTKYLGGHNDLLAGVIGGNDDDLRARMHWQRNAIGSVIGPDGAGRLKAHLQSFRLRLRQQNETAARVADFLNGHEGVGKLRYPGLSGHPGRDLARRMFADRGFGAMISFEVNRAPDEMARFVDDLRQHIPHIGSLGDVHTSFLHVRACFGDDYPPGLIRLSVGTEPAEDIMSRLGRVL